MASCTSCQKRARITKLDRVPIVAVPMSNIPFSHVSIDLVGPLEPKSSAGHSYIICLIDSMTKWADALPLKTLKAAETCTALMLMFTRIGIPATVVADNGMNLVAGLSKELYSRLGIQLRNSTPLHPEGNSAVERFNSSLKKMLHHVVISDQPRQWHLALPYLLWAYRELPSQTTGLSPFQMVYGRQVRGPLGILRDSWDHPGVVQQEPRKLEVAEYMDRLQKDLARALEIAGANSKAAQEVYVKYYNKTAKHKEFEPGDQVLVLLPTSTNKLLSEWMGPGTVVEVVSPYSYKILLSSGSIRTLHANKLRRFVSRSQTVGVVYDEDIDFGDIEVCPVVNPIADEAATVEAIANLDLSHLKATQATQLRKLLIKHRLVFNNRPGTCNAACHQINLVEGFRYS